MLLLGKMLILLMLEMLFIELLLTFQYLVFYEYDAEQNRT